MGSVGDNYRCTICGITGMGGYALDGIGVPICTDGRYSCLWKLVDDRGGERVSPRAIMAQALFAILGNARRQTFSYEFVNAVAEFLCPF